MHFRKWAVSAVDWMVNTKISLEQRRTHNFTNESVMGGEDQLLWHKGIAASNSGDNYMPLNVKSLICL